MFLKGLILGFSIAAPVGPIGLLCIQRTLARGRLHGFISGLGAATADMIYGLLAALGLSTVTQFLLGLQCWLQLGGGLFLVWLGARSLLRVQVRHVSRDALRGTPHRECHLLDDKLPKAPAGERHSIDDTSPGSAGLMRNYFSVLALTLTNPATILSFVAVFAAMGIGAAPDKTSAVALVAGVFVGSAAWWLLLSLMAGLLRDHLNDGRMRAVNLLAGGGIMALGLWALGTLAWAQR